MRHILLSIRVLPIAFACQSKLVCRCLVGLLFLRSLALLAVIKHQVLVGSTDQLMRAAAHLTDIKLNSNWPYCAFTGMLVTWDKPLGWRSSCLVENKYGHGSVLEIAEYTHFRRQNKWETWGWLWSQSPVCEMVFKTAVGTWVQSSLVLAKMEYLMLQACLCVKICCSVFWSFLSCRLCGSLAT